MLETDALNLPPRQLLARIYLSLGRADLAMDQANTCMMIAESTGNDRQTSLDLIAEIETSRSVSQTGFEQLSTQEREAKKWIDRIFSDAFDEKLSAIVGRVVSEKIDTQDRPPQYARDIKYEFLKIFRARLASEFDLESLAHAITFFDWWDHFRYCLDRVKVDGDYLEFGVWTGGTINFAAQERPDKIIHGFDSFHGLPDAWHNNPVGFLSLDGEAPEVKDNVRLHKGYFEDTLPGFLEEHKSPAAFVHIDCDIYSSTVTVLEALKDRLRPGTVIVFDEYIGDEKRAFVEFTNRYGIRYKYLSYSLGSGQNKLAAGAEHGVPPYYHAEIFSVSVVIEGFVTAVESIG